MRWLVGTVAETIPETPEAVTVRLDVPDWPGHRAGQHVDIRLTAEDGYTAGRPYSIASAPGADRLDLTVVRFEDGEVSPYLTTVLDVGDELELRGPIGGYFVWDADPGDERAVLLVGGGSGVVPLMTMLRHHARIGSAAPMRLVYSARTEADVLYGDELARLHDGDGREVVVTLTRQAGPGWRGRRGRVDGGLLAEGRWTPQSRARCYVCGPTPFVEAVAGTLVGLGHAPADVLTERFGPTGG
jgi:ferredoxin-NADP reductase